MQLLTPVIDLLVCLKFEIGLGGQFWQVRVFRAHRFVQVRKMVVPFLEGPLASSQTDMDDVENDFISTVVNCTLKLGELAAQFDDFLATAC